MSIGGPHEVLPPHGGVIGGRGHATQRDAREAIAASPAEVIYLDPPYPGTTGYGAYGLLDTLLGDDLPAAHPALWADPRHLALT